METTKQIRNKIRKILNSGVVLIKRFTSIGAIREWLRVSVLSIKKHSPYNSSYTIPALTLDNGTTLTIRIADHVAGEKQFVEHNNSDRNLSILIGEQADEIIIQNANQSNIYEEIVYRSYCFDDEHREQTLTEILQGLAYALENDGIFRKGEMGEYTTHYNTTLEGMKTKTDINKEIRQWLDQCWNTPLDQFTDEHKQYLRQYTGDGGTKTNNVGILNEYYTPDYVCQFMFELALKYLEPRKNVAVLEPSCGIGNMLKPFHDYNGQRYFHIDAFEMNKYSARIAEILYKERESNNRVFIHNLQFETAFLQKPRFNDKVRDKYKPTWLTNYPYNIVIGNPPYGKYAGEYASYFTGKERMPLFELFFMYKSLQLLQSGGVLVFITPMNILSTGSAYQNQKRAIGEIADFVDAYRLPKVFESTPISTDIIVLRKK